MALLSQPGSIPSPRANQRANGIATRTRVVHVAAQLFGSQGYSGTSLRQIASAGNINLATLKYHFGDKANLFAEVYRLGHNALLELLAPMLGTLSTLENPEDLGPALNKITRDTYEFLEKQPDFVRMSIFRILEEPGEEIAPEAHLQGDIIAALSKTFEDLAERGIVRKVDISGLVVMLLSALPTWHLCTKAKKSWFRAETPEDSKYFADFFSDLLFHHLRP